ncbi:MAG: hypothetical protein KDA57_21305 [Planctomycetales bacterium]|nr:hypothetical protein [Planctomycetales bacterium]
MNRLATPLLLFAFLGDAQAITCSPPILSLHEASTQLFNAKKHVFVAVVGPTERLASESEGQTSIISAPLEVVDVLKGAFPPETTPTLRLAQSGDTYDPFAWRGDWVLVFSDGPLVTEQDFRRGCIHGSFVIGNHDRHDGHDQLIEALRRLGAES